MTVLSRKKTSEVALRLKKSHDFHQSGLNELHACNYENALQLFLQAIEVSPALPEGTVNNLALAYFMNGDIVRAIEWSEKVLHTGHPFTIAALIHYYLLVDRLPDADILGKKLLRDQALGRLYFHKLSIPYFETYSFGMSRFGS